MKKQRSSPFKATPALGRWLKKVKADAAIEALADLMPNAAIFVVDQDQTVLFWSHGAERLLGFDSDEVVGAHCSKSNRCVQCMAGCGIATFGRVDSVPLSLYRSDGSIVSVRKTAMAFFDENGDFGGGIEVLVPARESASTRRPIPLMTNEFHGLISCDEVMLQAFRTIQNVSATDATVLVRGESGSGKELVARAVHEESQRSAELFVAVNCASLSTTLLESELFGHVKGAFTGAIRDHAGLFRQAHRGTLFLDEVAELPLGLQAKLLRVLEGQEFTPVGSTKTVSVDVRIVAATHRSLREEVKEGRFRQDLMFRLRVVPLFIPPLRERRGDIELLLWHFISQHNKRGLRRVERVAPEAMIRLLDHSWPGNIRELKNIVQYAFAVGRGEELLPAELPPEFRKSPQTLSKVVMGIEVESEGDRIRRALTAVNGHLGKAAELLGVSRATLWRKRKKHGI
jgi:two-component system, NtrC family, response regulator AtoC